jgi:hypothetical protein
VVLGSASELSMPTEWTIHRGADAAVEVGLAHGTQSAGKPRTRGRGEAERDWLRDTLPVLTVTGKRCQHNSVR